ncbi:hypothetical protein J6590_060088 [Homalodisca vitripennis]|nr:hypothetical protein J6590_060088 [Homalodisca vitripennis]
MNDYFEFIATVLRSVASWYGSIAHMRRKPTLVADCLFINKAMTRHRPGVGSLPTPTVRCCDMPQTLPNPSHVKTRLTKEPRPVDSVAMARGSE